MPYINRKKKKSIPKSSALDKTAIDDIHSISAKSDDLQQERNEENDKELNNLSSEDIEEAKKLIKDIPSIASSVSNVIQNVTARIENDELNMEKGLSFLDLKNLNMLNYISNLSYIILRKLNGRKIEDDPSVKRLAELRVVMEKMRPIEDKLKYQINKLLDSASSENIDTNDPLKFRANPDSLVAQDDVDGDKDADEDELKETKAYVPPKISATYYDEENILERKKKELERVQKRALSSRMLSELRQEYDTGPEEIKETVDPYKIKLSEELKERERFEEDFMSRLPMTKRQRHDMKQLTTVTNFDLGFDDISALERTSSSGQSKKKSKFKKGKFKNKSKKKGFKKKL